MSEDYAGQDPLDIARRAERDLNSRENQSGLSSREDTATKADPEASGVSAPSTTAFPGSTLTTGSAASGREIPPSQGGDIIVETSASKPSHPSESPGRSTGAGRGSQQRVTRDTDFEGEGGPEDKRVAREVERPGDDDVRGNVRN